ncbi:MAG: adenylate/guanylate cyclase domain-containing protein [Pseudomonadota bacterium]
MRFRANRLFAAFVGIAVLLGAILVRSLDPAPLVIARDRVFDLYQRIDPPQISADLPIRIVDIDEAALAAYGQWPWPRTLLAELVDKLRASGAAVVAFDMLFAEPDRASPDAVIASLGISGDTRRAIEDEVSTNLGHDAAFATALGSMSTVLGLGNGTEAAPQKAGFAFAGPPPNDKLSATPGVVANLPILQEATSGLGMINVSERDEDAVVRRIPAVTRAGDNLVPSLFLETLRVAQGAQSYVVRSNPDPIASGLGIPHSVRVGQLSVPLTETGAYFVRYGRLAPEITLSAADILTDQPNGTERAPRVSGTIVLVGTSAAGLFDLRASALGELVPGVAIHAQAIASVLNGTNLSRPDWANGAEIVAIATLGALTLLIAFLARPLVAALLFAAIAVGTGYASLWAFESRLLLLDAVAPTISIAAVFLAVTVPRLVFTDQQQRFIRKAFSLYLAEPVLARLEKDPAGLKLEGEKRPITVMFMDVRGFTARSETMEPPAAVELLNGLLDPLSQIVLSEEGTIDKFMGDGMMAFWNAPVDQPDHAIRAVRAGRQMVDWLDARNMTLPEDHRLRIGIGIHTGDAFVGNMGSTRRFAYSAIGDTVNLASRVEGLAGSTLSPLLVTNETKRAIEDLMPSTEDAVGFTFHHAGSHTVKGRAAEVTVFRVASS